MTDTPEHVKQLQLQIWLAKSPMERLRQMMQDNDALFAFWDSAKQTGLPQKDATCGPKFSNSK